MTDLSKMVEGSIDWPVGGEIYKLSPIKIKGMGLFTRWVENKYIDDMVKISESLENGGAEFLTKALKAKPTGIELSEKVSQVMVTLEGTKELIYISLKQNHSEITREKVDEIITFENLKLAQDLLDSVSGFGSKDSGKKGKKKKKKREDSGEDSKKKLLTGEKPSVSSPQSTAGHQSK